ncbi:MAG: ImmA/IrrE family metallo-endopeptidase [Geminicoccaceae bacterium]|nr:ImmA/IrrE family metallo-endopeptidase [Geminicoccaceae bacterium]
MAKTIVQLIHRAQRTAPVDVCGLAEDLGLTVNMAYLDADVSGELVQVGPDKYAINVNALDANSRQRFTIAHELGHYIYHRDLIGDGVDDDRIYRSTSSGRYHNTRIGPREETEANKFAASLLMPQHLIDKIRDEDSPRKKMAETLGVSEHALAIRLGEPYP